VRTSVPARFRSRLRITSDSRVSTCEIAANQTGRILQTSCSFGVHWVSLFVTQFVYVCSCAFEPHQPVESVALRGEIISPAITLSFLPVLPLRVVSTPLSSALQVGHVEFYS